MKEIKNKICDTPEKLYYIILKSYKKITENKGIKFAQKWMRKQNGKLSDIFAIIDR